MSKLPFKGSSWDFMNILILNTNKGRGVAATKVTVSLELQFYESAF